MSKIQDNNLPVKEESNKNRKRKAKDENQQESKKSKKSSSDKKVVKIDDSPQWENYELLSEQLSLDLDVAKNVIKLFEDGNTIPFIARYRKNITNNMTPEELRIAKETCEEISCLKSKISSVLKNLNNSNLLNEQLKYSITTSRTLEELEYIYAPYKPGSKRTLAERAKELGLEEPALAILHNKYQVKLSDYVKDEELSDVAAVEKGIIHIIASIISTDTEIMSSLRDLRKNSNFQIQTKKTSSKESTKTTNKLDNKGREDHKFDNYMDFQTTVKYIKPHQILAINRGESMKILSVKIIVPETFFFNFQRFCSNKWLKNKGTYEIRRSIMTQAIEDSYKRLVEPLIKREIRSELKQKAERASCEVFSGNLKHLLLAAPIKGKPILGIDPGRKNSNFQIQTKKTSSKESTKTTNKLDNKGREDHKFDNYMDFQTTVKYIKPHQILAINRGESMKILSVKIIVPETFFFNFQRFCSNKWLKNKGTYEIRRSIMTQAIEDSYKRLVEPLIKREIRSELKQKAERASCEVFSGNLKHLLLAAPIKGKPILGIDPGYANGCKLGLISPMGTLIASDTIYPHKRQNAKMDTGKDERVLKRLLLENNCELIALGNGTACRQTEEWLTNLIEKKTFHPLDVRFTVVREDGASIYSCGAEAKKEFPNLDPNIISAVSLARRIQDPLAELVKVEPKHLGIGMYQHDLKKKQLEEALNDVISECVSFVGVDLNTASQCLLRHVAGLTEKKAQHIIDYRNTSGPFICRKQLLDVSGIGPKVFLQCAGFLRVGPLNSENSDNFYKNKKATKLDCTSIHPESYDLALKLLKKLDLKLCDLGEESFITNVKNKIQNLNLTELQKEFKTDEQTLLLIQDALSKTLNYDLRSCNSKEPIFKKGFTTIEDVTSGSILTGVISNVTHFGCFVDIGVGVNGLIHSSKYNGLNPQIGDRVEVRVINVDITKKRIGLESLKILS